MNENITRTRGAPPTRTARNPAPGLRIRPCRRTPHRRTRRTPPGVPGRALWPLPPGLTPASAPRPRTEPPGSAADLTPNSAPQTRLTSRRAPPRPCQLARRLVLGRLVRRPASLPGCWPRLGRRFLRGPVFVPRAAPAPAWSRSRRRWPGCALPPHVPPRFAVPDPRPSCRPRSPGALLHLGRDLPGLPRRLPGGGQAGLERIGEAGRLGWPRLGLSGWTTSRPSTFAFTSSWSASR